MEKDILGIEESELNQYQQEMEKLNDRWFKTSKTKNYVDFLKWYIQEKKKLIEVIEAKIN